MIIDCDTCKVRGIACGDCVIGVLLGPPAGSAGGDNGVSRGASSQPGMPSGASTVQFDAAERRAIDLLAAQGLIPRLRLVADMPRRTTDRADPAQQQRDAG